MGGSFQILNVKGTDRLTIAGEPGDAWQVRFLAIPRFGIDATPAFDAINSIGVRIGTRYESRINGQRLTSSGSGKIQYKADKTGAPVVTNFSLDGRKFIGTLTTNSLSAFSTGIPQAGASARPSVNFTLGLDIDRTGNNADFSGENSKAVYNKAQGARGVPGTQWVDQINLR
jgi:hypothetical protein